LPDVKSSDLEGVNHTAVLQVLHDTKRLNFSLITIIYNILLVCVSEHAQLHERNYGLRFVVVFTYSQFTDAEKGIRSCLIGELN
jgi:hypothetical protein